MKIFPETNPTINSNSERKHAWLLLLPAFQDLPKLPRKTKFFIGFRGRCLLTSQSPN